MNLLICTCQRNSVVWDLKLFFWFVMPCGLGGGYRRSGGTYCLHLQGVTIQKTIIDIFTAMIHISLWYSVWTSSIVCYLKLHQYIKIYNSKVYCVSVLAQSAVFKVPTLWRQLKPTDGDQLQVGPHNVHLLHGDGLRANVRIAVNFRI